MFDYLEFSFEEFFALQQIAENNRERNPICHFYIILKW